MPLAQRAAECDPAAAAAGRNSLLLCQSVVLNTADLRPLGLVLVGCVIASHASAAEKVYGAGLANRPLTVPRRSWLIEVQGGIGSQTSPPEEVALAPDALPASDRPVTALFGEFGLAFNYGITDRLQATLPLILSLEVGDSAVRGGVDVTVFGGLTNFGYDGASRLNLKAVLGLAARQEFLPGVGWRADVSANTTSYLALQWYSVVGAARAALVWDVSERVSLALPVAVTYPVANTVSTAPGTPVVILGNAAGVAPVSFHAFRWLDVSAYGGATLTGPVRSVSAGLALSFFLMEREGPWLPRLPPPVEPAAPPAQASR